MKKRIIIFFVLLVLCVGLIYLFGQKAKEMTVQSDQEAVPKNKVKASDSSPQTPPTEQASPKLKQVPHFARTKKIDPKLEQKIVAGLQKWQTDNETKFEIEELESYQEMNAKGEVKTMSIVKVTSTAPNTPRISFTARVDAATGKIKFVWGRPQLHESDPAVKIRIPAPPQAP